MMTKQEKKRLARLEKQYDYLLSNTPVVNLATGKMPNNEAKINEESYCAKAIEMVDPLFDSFIEVCKEKKSTLQ